MTRPPWWLSTLGVLFVLFAVGLVVTSLRRPSLPTYTPDSTPEAGLSTALDSPVSSGLVTLDARDSDTWVRFSFSRPGVVPAAERARAEWDLAARRFHIIVNGGDGFTGDAGALDLGEVEFTRVERVPRTGYSGTGRSGGEPRHPVLEEWYRYSIFSHLLRPEPRTYAIRTSDGRFAKIRLLSYYCPGAEPGCVTFRYAFRVDGGADFPSAPAPAASTR